MSYVRPNIAAMQAYLSGEQPPPGKFIKLNTNENPYPASPSVARAIARVLERGLNRYPDLTAEPFRQRAAQVLGVEPSMIVCGNGSDDILTICTRAFVGEGQAVRMPFPSYTFYRTLADIQGARCERVRFRDDWTLGDEFAAPASDVKLVFLPNPNAPSGTRLPPQRIGELAAQLDCPLLVDEAYADFADGNCLELLRSHPNVLISRSLSKSYSLAGLRFGFLVGPPELIRMLMKVKDPANCDALAIAAATAAIDDQAWMLSNRDKILATRTRLTEATRALGFATVESQANFVWCPHPRADVQNLFERLREQQVLIRYFDFPGWGAGLRISVGADEQVDVVVELLKQALR